MKIGVFAVLFSQMPFEKMLDHVAEAGCEAVEIGVGGYPGDAHCDSAALLKDAAAQRRFLRAIESRGLVISALSCHGNPVHPQQAVARKHHEAWRRAVRLAQALGVARVITCFCLAMACQYRCDVIALIALKASGSLLVIVSGMV